MNTKTLMLLAGWSALLVVLIWWLAGKQRITELILRSYGGFSHEISSSTHRFNGSLRELSRWTSRYGHISNCRYHRNRSNHSKYLWNRQVLLKMIYLLFILAGLLLFFLFGPNKYIDKWASSDHDNTMDAVRKHNERNDRK